MTRDIIFTYEPFVFCQDEVYTPTTYMNIPTLTSSPLFGMHNPPPPQEEDFRVFPRRQRGVWGGGGEGWGEEWVWSSR
jgi:hypothetical protein